MHDPHHMSDADHAEGILTIIGGALLFGSCAALTIAMFILLGVAFDIPWGLR